MPHTPSSLGYDFSSGHVDHTSFCYLGSIQLYICIGQLNTAKVHGCEPTREPGSERFVQTLASCCLYPLELKSKRDDVSGPTSGAKRLQAIQFTINSLQKLAASQNCAIVVLSQCASKMQFENSSTLIPSINTTTWDQGVSSRIVLFRDWTWSRRNCTGVIFAGVQRLDGRSTLEYVENACSFQVGSVSQVFSPLSFTTNLPTLYLVWCLQCALPIARCFEYEA